MAMDNDKARMQVVALVNRTRRRAGLRPLKYSKTLQRSAQRHAEDMHRKGYLSHVSKNGDDIADRIWGAGWKGGHIAENIAEGFSSAASVHAAWMKSPKHREQILDRDNKAIGVGIAGEHWVQNFGG